MLATTETDKQSFLQKGAHADWLPWLGSGSGVGSAGMGQENCLQLGGRFTSKLKQRHPPRPPLREKNFGSNVVTRNEKSLAYQQDYSITKVSYIVWLCMLVTTETDKQSFLQKGADADWLPPLCSAGHLQVLQQVVEPHHCCRRFIGGFCKKRLWNIPGREVTDIRFSGYSSVPSAQVVNCLALQMVSHQC